MESIKDKVAIVGMGCSRFGERWDCSAWDLVVEAAYEAFEDAGVGPKESISQFISAYRWIESRDGLCRMSNRSAAPGEGEIYQGDPFWNTRKPRS